MTKAEKTINVVVDKLGYIVPASIVQALRRRFTTLPSRAEELRRGAEQTAERLRGELLTMERRALRAEARLADAEERLYALESERKG